jgi:hypothetical protein
VEKPTDITNTYHFRSKWGLTVVPDAHIQDDDDDDDDDDKH